MTKATETKLLEDVAAIQHRIYNGLGKEIRFEVAKELSGVRSMVIGIMVALLLALAGIVIEGRVSSNQSSTENMRNYKAIVDIGSQLENHILRTAP